ncbi:MAG: DJ-1/PfpI family protein [Anaerolineales bacterium]
MTDEQAQTPPQNGDDTVEDVDMQRQRNVGVLMFDDVEVLDFAGPFEVFHVTGELNDPSPFNVFTIGVEEYPIETRGKLSVTPDWSLETTPPVDILLVPGGRGTRALLDNDVLLDWLRDMAEQVELLLSVCTGSLLLGKAGLLNGIEATTHHGAYEELRKVAPKAVVKENLRYIDSGKIITSGGISAGIDMALYVVQRLHDDAMVQKTSDYMEYTWNPAPER